MRCWYCHEELRAISSWPGVFFYEGDGLICEMTDGDVHIPDFVDMARSLIEVIKS